MLEELETLTGKLTELSARVRMLRAENLQLRAQLGASQAESAALRDRVSTATRRIDALLAQLGPQADPPATAEAPAASSPSPANAGKATTPSALR